MGKGTKRHGDLQVFPHKSQANNDKIDTTVIKKMTPKEN